MPKYEIEYRVVEIHSYTVEAPTEYDAIARTDNAEPEIISISYEIEHIEEMSPVQEAQELLAEIKEDVQQLKTELSDKEYYDLRGDNIEYLTGAKK